MLITQIIKNYYFGQLIKIPDDMVMVDSEDKGKQFVEEVFIKMKSKAIIEHIQKLLFPICVGNHDVHRDLITISKNVY